MAPIPMGWHWHDDLGSRPPSTPVVPFVLLSDGSEAGRIEGYVGQRYFYPVLEEMMRGAGLTLGA